MAFYLVRARLRDELSHELRLRLDRGEFEDMRPFGGSLTISLEGARLDPDTGEAVWEEEDYCTPPLAQERAAVLDQYFDGLQVEPVETGEGWAKIRDFPSLWESEPSKTEDQEVQS